MALVDLPDAPGPTRVTPMVQDFGGPVPGLLGGETDRQNRLGNRWSMTLGLPPMSPHDARIWSADLTLGIQRGVRWRLRQVGLVSGPIGVPLVAGAGQAGFALECDGFSPGAAWDKGAFVNLVSGGRRYLHKLATHGFADGSGEGVLHFTEAMRVFPADNDVVDFAPMIEGLLSADTAVEINEARLSTPLTIMISEQA